MGNLHRWLEQQTSPQTGLESHTDNETPEVDTTPQEADQNAVTAFESFQDCVASMEVLQGDLTLQMQQAQHLSTLWSSMESSMIDGGMPVAMAGLVQSSLESLQYELDVEPSVMASVEDFGAHGARRVHTQTAMEAANSTLDTMIKRVKEILKKLWEYLREAWTHLTNGVGRAEQRLNGLKQRLKGLDRQSGKVNVTISSLNRLSVGGNFAGLDPSALKEGAETTHFIAQTYPKEISSFMTAVTKEYDKVMMIDPGGRQIERLVASMTDLLKNTKLSQAPGEHGVRQNQLTGKAAKATNARAGYILPGNHAVVRYFSPVLLDVEERNDPSLWVFTRTFGLDFQGLSGVAKNKDDSITVSPTCDVLEKVASGIEQWLKELKKVPEGTRAFKAAQDEIQKAIESNSTLRAISPAINSAVIGMTGALGQCQQPVTNYIGYSVQTINAYMAVLEHCIKAHEAGGERGDTRTGRAVATT